MAVWLRLAVVTCCSSGRLEEAPPRARAACFRSASLNTRAWLAEREPLGFAQLLGNGIVRAAAPAIAAPLNPLPGPLVVNVDESPSAAFRAGVDLRLPALLSNLDPVLPPRGIKHPLELCDRRVSVDIHSYIPRREHAFGKAFSHGPFVDVLPDGIPSCLAPAGIGEGDAVGREPDLSRQRRVSLVDRLRVLFHQCADSGLLRIWALKARPWGVRLLGRGPASDRDGEGEPAAPLWRGGKSGGHAHGGLSL